MFTNVWIALFVELCYHGHSPRHSKRCQIDRCDRERCSAVPETCRCADDEELSLAISRADLQLGRAAAWGSPSPSMPVIPIPRRVRSFHGPHTTCMHSACGPARTAQLVRSKYNNFDLYLKSRWMYGFVRFLLYFGCSLFTSLLWVALSALFCLQYVGVRIFLRLQYKLSIILLLLGHQRLDFSLLNDLFIYSMHVTMFLVGGLGWCFMVFVDM